MGDDAGDAGYISEGRYDCCQGLLTLFGVRGWESLDHQDHAVNERRTKTSVQLLPDSFGFAAFDTGRRLQVALGVKREREKRDGGGKD
jgi:hypothetical protein